MPKYINSPINLQLVRVFFYYLCILSNIFILSKSKCLDAPLICPTGCCKVSAIAKPVPMQQPTPMAASQITIKKVECARDSLFT